MYNKEIRHIANNTVKQIGELSYSNIRAWIADNLGYAVIQDRIDASSPAFTDHKEKFIAISIQVNEEYAVRLLLHELAHLVLNHKPIFAGDKTKAENEAEYFVKCVLARPNKRRLIISAILFILLISTIAVTFIARQTGELQQTLPPTPTVQTTAPVVTTEPTTSTEVVITKTGDKYHRPDCQYVRSKTNTTTIDIDDAVNMGLEPCKVCRP